MKSNTSRLQLWNDAPKKTRKTRRMTFMDKALFVVQMINRNLDYHEALHGHRGFGFTMGQIASMVKYQPSTAFMNDLFKMCDEGLLRADTRASRYVGLSKHEHVFYTPAAWGAKAHKARKML
jgi:hypothetical protein